MAALMKWAMNIAHEDRSRTKYHQWRLIDPSAIQEKANHETHAMPQVGYS